MAKRKIKNCFLCGQPLHEIRVGPKRFPYYVHRGAELDRCTAVHPNPKSLDVLHRVMRHMAEKREKFRILSHEDGKIKLHGEPANLVYVAGHSGIWRGKPSYPQMLEAIRLESPHKYFYTVLGALYETQNMRLNRGDCIIFNFGVNDCIYRKDKPTQTRLLQNLINKLSKHDPESCAYFKGKLQQIQNKADDELVQLFTFSQFENFTRMLFKQYSYRAACIGPAWFPKTHPSIGWGHDQVEEVHHILKRLSEEYHLEFIDLWHPPELTEDGAHYTKNGHRTVAWLVRGVLDGIKGRNG